MHLLCEFIYTCLLPLAHYSLKPQLVMCDLEHFLNLHIDIACCLHGTWFLELQVYNTKSSWNSKT